MHSIILSPGKFTARSAEKLLFELYSKRLPHGIELREIDNRSTLPPLTQRELEGSLLLKAIPAGAPVIALDEKGKALTSLEFAKLLESLSMTKKPPLYFAIGGAYGLATGVKQRADTLLSFGSVTWPHMLMRVLVAEQLYRAYTILSGHPYHKGDL